MRRFIQKFLSPSGQHIIEYLMLITLVCAGIILMGPYVVRSWNAGVKTYESGYVDSMNEPLLHGSLPPPPCVCTNWTARVACGDPANGCACNEALETRICTSNTGATGCAPETQCVPDPACCCNSPYPGCDINANSLCVCGSSSTPSPDCFDQVTGGQNPGRLGCPPGERCMQLTCGNNPPFNACRQDITCPICQGLPVANGTFCPGDNLGLVIPLFVRTIVDLSLGGPGCSAPPGSSPKCEVVCTPPAWPLDAGGMRAPGGLGAVGVSCGTGGCPVGYTFFPVTTCPAGTIDCGGGFCCVQ